MLRSFLFYALSLRAARTLHNRMFSSVIRGPVLFFDTNPIGRYQVVSYPIAGISKGKILANLVAIHQKIKPTILNMHVQWHKATKAIHQTFTTPILPLYYCGSCGSRCLFANLQYSICENTGLKNLMTVKKLVYACT